MKCRAAAALAALALLAPAAGAQIAIQIPPQEGVIAGELDPVPGTFKPGGYGYATLALRNLDTRSHELEVSLRARSWRAHEFSCLRRLELGPGEAARLVLPLPTGHAGSARVEIHAGRLGRGWEGSFQTASSSAGPAVLCITDQPARRAAWEQRLDELTRRHAPPPPRGRTPPKSHLAAFHARGAADLPDRWPWLTGFDVVVVDAGARGLDAAAQGVLRDLVTGGGSLLVLYPTALPAGPLRQMLLDGAGAARAAGGRHGLGRWLAFSEVEASAADDRALEAWLLPAIERSLDAANPRTTGPVPQPIQALMSIPGLGDVPVRLFFLFILAFAIVVGPVNHFIAYRRKKPLQMLLTVPALGIGCTLLLLAYGVLSEGLGIQGVIRSFTVLDQREHRATGVSGRTLYAGLSPAALVPRASTYLYSPQFHARTYRELPHALSIDLDTGLRIGGSALPSRVPTSFAAVHQGTCRERLRFRRRDDGGLDLLAGPTFAPAPGHGTLWLRDQDERVYRNEPDGRMVPATEGELRAAVQQASARLTTDPGAAWPGAGEVTVTVTTKPQEALEHLEGFTLPPGGYLAVVSAMPAVDDFGLSVDYVASWHVVVGQLAEEDVLQ